MKKAYGGVIINETGQVLLREPANHYDGYVWTFAKGKADPGESPETTALREVEEETGIRGKIVAKIPGTFDGSTTSNEYFLMSAVKDTGKLHWETSSVKWVDQEEAEKLLLHTSNQKGRLRDLELLEAAFELFNSTQAPGPKVSKL
jgi:8-oxo-dGTP diphosphatase